MSKKKHILTNGELFDFQTEVNKLRDELEWLDPELESNRFNANLARLEEIKKVLQESLIALKAKKIGVRRVK